MRGFLRALAAHCPLCGERRIWVSFGQTVDVCPGCGYTYAREEGYWVGGMIVAIGIAMGLFFVMVVGGMLVTWPDVPWTALLISTLAVMALAPVLLYRQSKTIWVWIDLKVHPYHGAERDWERT